MLRLRLLPQKLPQRLQKRQQSKQKGPVRGFLAKQLSLVSHLYIIL